MFRLSTVNSSLTCRTSIARFLSPRLPRCRPQKLATSADSLSQEAIALSISTQNGTAPYEGKSAKGSFKGPVFGSPGMSEVSDPFLEAGLQQELMPKHVAAILDGNRRWAKAHGKELDYSIFCHGYIALADLCIKWGIGTLSCFIFSSENWKRSKEANDLLFSQFQRCLEQNVDTFTRKGIKAAVIGEKTRLPERLQEVIKQVEEGTKSNTSLELNFAVNYGGKWDIVQAIRCISRKAKAREIELEDINEALMNQQLSTGSLRAPNPDLMIRTGGDRRVSNFLMWQMSHTEFYFTDVYGPDFGEPDFIDALRLFQQCDRRFGE